jgi:hypothetical protein
MNDYSAMSDNELLAMYNSKMHNNSKLLGELFSRNLIDQGSPKKINYGKNTK